MAKVTITVETDGMSYDEREALSVIQGLKPAMEARRVEVKTGPGKIHCIKMLRTFACQMERAQEDAEGERAEGEWGFWTSLRHCKLWYERYAVTGWGFDR
jgi:hypothetical protein